MSSNLDCSFYEKKPLEWYYDLQVQTWDDDDEDRARDEDEEEYDTYGPFGTFAEALRHLDRNHANPGGWSMDPHKDSPDRSWESNE